MATATIRDGVNNLRTLRLTHNAAVSAGDVIVSAGQVLIAVNDALINTANAYVYKGKVEFPKEAQLVVAPGETLYWDAAAGKATKTAENNTKLGIAVEVSAQVDTTVLCLLSENK